MTRIIKVDISVLNLEKIRCNTKVKIKSAFDRDLLSICLDDNNSIIIVHLQFVTMSKGRTKMMLSFLRTHVEKENNSFSILI